MPAKASPLLLAAAAVVAASGIFVLLASTGQVSVGGPGAFYSFPGTQLAIPIGCQGVTVLSVSQPSFIGTNLQALSGLNWILQFASGGSECIQWGKSPTDLALGTGGQVKNGVTFVAKDYKERITYDLRPDGGEKFIFDYWAADLGLSGWDSLGVYDRQTADDGWIWVKSGFPLPACPAGPSGRAASAQVILQRGGFGFGFAGAGESFKLWCVAHVQAGATAAVVGPGKRHSATFEVSNGAETLSRAVGVGEGDVGASFTFSGVTQAAATLKMVSISSAPAALDPSTNRLLGLRDLTGADAGKWWVVTEGGMSNFDRSYLPARARVDAANTLVLGASVPDATDAILTEMKNANDIFKTIPNVHVVTAPGFTETTTGGAEGGRLEYVGPPVHFVTTYQLLVSAQWVGVFLPSGKPVVVSVSPLDLGIAASGTVTVAVKNDATVAASFNSDVSCSPATVNAVSPPRLVPFGPGETKNLQIAISKGTTTETVDAQCTVRFCDSEMPTACDSKTTRVTAQVTGACTPGTQLPLASEVQECGPDGRYRTIATCPTGVEIGDTAGTFKCRTTVIGQTPPPPTGVPTPVPPPTGGDFVRRGGAVPWMLIAVVAGVVAVSGIAAWAFVRTRRPPGGGFR